MTFTLSIQLRDGDTSIVAALLRALVDDFDEDGVPQRGTIHTADGYAIGQYVLLS